MSINDLNTLSFSKQTVKLGMATTPEEKFEVYRFRYRIYAEEMSKRFPNMDHKNKVLYDELDDWAFIVYAKAGAEIIGTLRVNIGELNDFSPFWIQVLDLNKFAKFNNKQRFAYTSKFMVTPSYRNSTVSYLLAAESYELYCKHSVQFSFGVCNFHLLRLYEQFGFRRFGRNFIDDGYGLLAPYVLLVDDIAHLRAVRSPFFRAARKRNSLNKEALSWFSSEFSETGAIINSQLVSPEELWTLLSLRFDASPNQALTILHGLSNIEALNFLHCCGVVVQCFAGDQIVFKGDTSYGLNLLISGRLQQANYLHAITDNISLGQPIGINGLVNHPTHTENIFAITDAEILVLSSLAFPKFRHLHPDIANKIMQNMVDTEAVHQIV